MDAEATRRICKKRRVPFAGNLCGVCRARAAGRELEAAGLEEREREAARKETT
jgi:hypothetical protein